MTPPAKKHLLVFTDTRYVSAILFHGLGLPPWYDLPELQRDPAYRLTMARRVNRLLPLARGVGFTAFDVQEAFPVDLMELSADVRVLRGCDRVLAERGYAGAAFLRARLPGLKRQPRWKCIRRMSLDGTVVDEVDLLALCLTALRIPVVYADSASKAFVQNSGRSFRDSVVTAVPRRRRRQFVVDLAPKIPVDPADYFPGVTQVGAHRVAAEVTSADQALDVYRYIGLVIQRTGAFKAKQFAGAS